jgi:hypothetical protein
MSRPSAEEKSMGGIDWTNIPLEDFHQVDEEREDGKGLRTVLHPHGEGVAQRLMMRLCNEVTDAYEGLLSDEDGERYQSAGEVPVIRDGRKGYDHIDSLTLADLPTILDALVAMDEEARALEAEEAARRDAERKRRSNARARERRKREKLGEGKRGEW